MRNDGVAQDRLTLERLGVAETEIGAIGATIARGGRPAPRGGPPRLPRLAMAMGGDDDGDLAVGEEIGRGGMGIVRVAEQRSIGRDVAIKTVKADDPVTSYALIREGRIMGALEHPNLVPIHALGTGPDGAPVLVMKRVDGLPWRELLLDDAHPGWAPLLVGHNDRLRANIEILAQLCRALAFAHERGVVHLDLKPENVMIGRFGEVVLLDWGIAVRLAERDTEPKRVTGTPGYLAPELARADPTLVDERTDVYLLGATLYEILTGRMIHEAPTSLAAIASALLGEIPPLPSSAPAELARLVERACALEPEQRPATVEAFREELQRFLATRNADALVDEARSALERAASERAREGPASASAFRALIEARFALASAQRLRPNDESIAIELDRAVVLSVERELGLRSPDAARALLPELTRPRPELERAIDDLTQELAAERAAAEALAASRRAADASAAVRPLTFIMVAGVVLSTVFATAGQFAAQADGGHWSRLTAFLSSVIALGVVVGGAYAYRERLLATNGTRRLIAVYGTCAVAIVVSDGVSYGLGATVPEAAAHASVALGAAITVAAALHLRGLWPMIPVHAAAILAIILAPQIHIYFVVGVLFFDWFIFVRVFRREGARSRAEARADDSA